MSGNLNPANLNDVVPAEHNLLTPQMGCSVLGSGTVLDSLRVSKNVDLPQARFWIRVDYPEPYLSMILDKARFWNLYTTVSKAFSEPHPHACITTFSAPRKNPGSHHGETPAVQSSVPVDELRQSRLGFTLITLVKRYGILPSPTRYYSALHAARR
ncbi:hypothetical protein Bbelb_108470 [Branchiostoma belcheri]|nr:hypothetical protein Bbelb_108470 [Branchiostoma belcheri]